MHPVKLIKEIKYEGKKSKLVNKPEVNLDIVEYGETQTRKTVEKLREIYIESTDELDMCLEEEKQVKASLEDLKKEINKAEDEKNRYRELYMAEVKKQNDLRNFIYNQKIMRKSQSYNKIGYKDIKH